MQVRMRLLTLCELQCAYAAQNGVTSIQDMSGAPAILRGYQRLLDRGELSVRVYALQPLSEWERLAKPGIRAGFGNEKLKIGGLKGFADGSPGFDDCALLRRLSG